MSVISNNTLAGSSGQGGAGYEIERSLRFNSGDSANLSRTPSSSSNRNTYTYSGWVKRSQLGTTSHYLFSAQDGANVDFLGFDEDRISWYNSYSGGVNSADKFRDASAWYHVVFSVDSTQSTAADRVKIYVNNRQITSFYSNLYPSQNRDFAINHTVAQYIGHYGGSYSSNFYLTEVHFIDGQALAATDFGEYDSNSVWQPIEYAGTYGTNGFKLDFSDTSSDAALGTDSSGNGNTWTNNNLTATNLGATSNSSVSASNTYAVSDAYGTNTYYTFSQAFDANASTTGVIGQVIFHNEGTYSKPIVSNSSGGVEVIADGAGVTAAINGGSQVTCTDGSFTKISGTFNGTLDSINVYNNTSGNSYFKSVRVNGVEIAVRKKGPASEIDFYRDSPSQIADQTDTGVGGEVVGNYATMNPLSKTSVITLSNGNLQISATQGHAKSTIGISSGKWYAEYTQGTGLGMCGVADKTAAAANYLGQTGNGYGYYSSGTTYAPGAAGSSYGASYTTGDVIGIAFDADNGTLVFYKNGSSQGTAFTGLTSGPYFFAVGVDTMANSTINFGQRAFAYTAPSGYKCLNTANLSDPTIADGSTAFDSKLYSGTGSSQSITGLGFSPDLVWTKNRGASASHALYDSVRGAGELLRSNETTAEVNVSSRFTSFDSNGFSIGGTSSENNGSSNSYVSWAWDAGSSNTTIAAGGLNSSLYDQSQTWSGGTTSGTISNGSWSNVFANTTSTSYADGNDVWVYQTNATINFSPALPNGAIEVYALVSGANAIGCKVTVSDGTNTYTTADLSSTSGAYYSVNNGSSLSGITSLTVHSAANSTQGMSLQGVRVGGKLLVDSGVSLANVPSIASTVRANPSAGFSIVKWTGTANATVAHGLNAAPQLVLTKSSQYATAWRIWSAYLSNLTDKYLGFDAAAEGTFNGYWGAMTSTTLGFPTVNLDNNYGEMIAYCFAPVEGYSAFGSYEGNGVADGPFVFTGFKPAFLLTKWIDGNDQWNIYDVKRSTFNVTDDILRPNYDYGENSDSAVDAIDILSNGFKIRSSNQNINAASTYIYYAVASHPFKTSRAR